MMLQSIDYVSRNLQHIHSAVQATSEPSLVADLRGDSLYDGTKGIMARLLRLVTYIFCRCIVGFRERRVSAALHKTVQLFLANKMQMDHLAQMEEKKISAACNGEEYNPKLTLEKRTIAIWRSHTGPFFDLWHSDRQAKVRDVFRMYGNHNVDALFEAEHKQLCDDLAFMYSLENVMLNPIPFAILKKLGLPKPELSANETTKLDAWVKEIRGMPFNRDFSMVSSFHSALKRIVKNIPEIPNEAILPTFGFIILRLQQRGYEEIIQKDVQWCEKREKFINHNLDQQAFKLGAELSDAAAETRVIEITGLNECVVLENNRVGLLAKREFADEMQEALKKQGFSELLMQEIHHVEDCGRYAHVQRLHPCSDIKWKSKFKKMDVDEGKLCDHFSAIISQLLTAVTNNKAITFAVQHLQRDSENRLRLSLESLSGFKLQQLGVSFNDVEDLIYTLANQNPIIFHYLQKQSRITSHKVAQFYQEVVENTLKDPAFNVDAHCKTRTIADPKVLERANELKRCVIVMKADYEQQIKKESEEAVKAATARPTVVTPPKIQRSPTLRETLKTPEQVMMECYLEVGNTGLLAINRDDALRRQFIMAIVQRYLNPPSSKEEAAGCSIC